MKKNKALKYGIIVCIYYNKMRNVEEKVCYNCGMIEEGNNLHIEYKSLHKRKANL